MYRRRVQRQLEGPERAKPAERAALDGIAAPERARRVTTQFGLPSPDRPPTASAMARRGSPTQLPLGDVDMSVYGFGDEASRKVRWVGPP